MRIVPTASAPSHIRRFACLQVDAWGHLYPNLTVERAESDLRTEPDEDLGAVMSSLCRAWFALDEDGGAMGVVMLLGSGELEPSDEAELPGPWLAGLIVAPEFRQRGVASALMAFAMNSARELHIDRLRLVTEHAVDFYERRGWTIERRVTLNSIPNTVMVTTLRP